VNDLLSVCVDDSRVMGDINIRNPNVALATLRRLHKQIGTLLMDNDMGGPFEVEGRNILKQFLTDCKNQNHYPKSVHILTSNTPAAEAMALSLKEHGYRKTDARSWKR
jgi:hypothetical protein